MDDMPHLRSAETSEFPSLISLWRQCFKDSRRVAENIFENLQKPENIFVLANENGISAMLSFREFSLGSPAGIYKAAYVYGVAVSPAEQGKGYGTLVLEKAGGILAQRGYVCSVLVPANKGLFGFYENRGYEKAFCMNKAGFEAEELAAGDAYPLKKIGAQELSAIRNARFGRSKMFARWDTEYLEFVETESEFYAGGVYAADIGGERVCAVCHKDGDTVYIKELSATLQTIGASLRSIHSHFSARRYRIYLRGDVMVPYSNNLLPFAVARWYDKDVKASMDGVAGEPAYIAHVLD